MSVELPDQREPIIENRHDLFANLTWYEFLSEFARQYNRSQIENEQLRQQVQSLTQRVEALENP